MSHLRRLMVCLGGFCLLGQLAGLGAAEERPNILWLTAEDMSAQLGCYGDADAHTPRLDRLAGQSVRYTHAFATASVCSPARSTLITGLYATSLGTQRLRSQFPIPAEFRPFPAYLREAGYYCTNNVKTDYNLRDEAAYIRDGWDESSADAHWRGRAPGQPFFAVFNFMVTHQSRTSVWPEEQFEEQVGAGLPPEERADPDRVTLPPYYPDTAEARQAWCRYLDCIAALDREVDELLLQLEADGLAENTIVFFYSDHGKGMPRGKRCLHDAGLHVPLLIRFPERWRHLAPVSAGETTDRLVSFVDFPPTVLALCGVPVPASMQGSVFLGDQADEPREYVFGARDRVDEAFDVSRSVRDFRWLYIRNYKPHLSWMQPESYSDGSSFRRSLRRLASDGELGPGPMTYAAPRRAREELYDTHADPHQIRNLASQPELEQVLDRMRRTLRDWQIETGDAGFLTEPQMWRRMADQLTPFELRRDPERYPLECLLTAADSVGGEEWEAHCKGLEHPDDGIRYWSVVGLHAASELPDPARAALVATLERERGPGGSPDVWVEAAAALANHGHTAEALPVLEAALEHEQGEIVLHAARSLELLGEVATPVHDAMRRTRVTAAERFSPDLAMFIRFSLDAALPE